MGSLSKAWGAWGHNQGVDGPTRSGSELRLPQIMAGRLSNTAAKQPLQLRPPWPQVLDDDKISTASHSIVIKASEYDIYIVNVP